VFADPAAALKDLARRVARLAPSHRDPERYHVEKSEIVAELRRLAAGLGPAGASPMRPIAEASPSAGPSARSRPTAAGGAARPVVNGHRPGAANGNGVDARLAASLARPPAREASKAASIGLTPPRPSAGAPSARPSAAAAPILAPPSAPQPLASGGPSGSLAGDPAVRSLKAWLLLTGNTEVAVRDVRQCGGLTPFAAAVLAERMVDGGLLAPATKLRPPSGRGRPRIRWPAAEAFASAPKAWQTHLRL
jgi:hypothetical protein